SPSAMMYVQNNAGVAFGVRYIAAGSGAISWGADIFSINGVGEHLIPFSHGINWGAINGQNVISIYNAGGFYYGLWDMYYANGGGMHFRDSSNSLADVVGWDQLGEIQCGNILM